MTLLQKSSRKRERIRQQSSQINIQKKMSKRSDIKLSKGVQWAFTAGMAYIAPVFTASSQIMHLIFMFTRAYDYKQQHPESSYKWGGIIQSISFVVPASVYAYYCITHDNVGKISMETQMLVGSVSGMLI